jgi:RNA polymerase sigma-70 factor (ECF subfamily)
VDPSPSAGGKLHMARALASTPVKDARALGWTDVGTDEAELVQRCATGDDAACAELVAQHQRMVYQLAFHLLGSREEALDLSQEVFLRVFRTVGSFRGQSSLRTWLFRIVVNQARNRQRWWRRRRQSDQVSLDQHVVDHGEPRQPGDDASPDRVLARKQTARRLWDALDRLPFDQRTAIVLREFDGLSYDEIAFSLDIAVGTVKSRLTRARHALRADLQESRL